MLHATLERIVNTLSASSPIDSSTDYYNRLEGSGRRSAAEARQTQDEAIQSALDTKKSELEKKYVAADKRATEMIQFVQTLFTTHDIANSLVQDSMIAYSAWYVNSGSGYPDPRDIVPLSWFKKDGLVVSRERIKWEQAGVFFKNKADSDKTYAAFRKAHP